MKKKILGALMVSACLLFTVPVHAEKKYFDFTISTAAEGRYAKASKGDNEQNTYITVTDFTKNGMVILYTHRGSIYGVRSYTATIKKAASVVRAYRPEAGKAKAGSGYYLQYDNIGGKKTRLAGRYNP